ncbi:MAG: nuclear transport factor 2 family protein [Ignavibacteria bacterium]|nr:nuclear transport factor 2 family protein [Ignavibacteria bacterium]
MKHLSIISILTILILAMGCQKTVDIEAEKSAVKVVLDSYIISIEKEDIELYGKIFVHDPDMVNFGTGANERIVGWDTLEKAIIEQNAVLSETKITQSDVTINVSPDGKFAWATSLWDFKATMEAQVMQLPIRCSWILEKQDNEWKIVHFHKSVGAAW